MVRRWMIEPSSGRVATSVSGFTCVAMRVVGIVLLQFSTLDVMCGAALATCGLAVTVVEPVLASLNKRDSPAAASAGGGGKSPWRTYLFGNGVSRYGGGAGAGGAGRAGGGGDEGARYGEGGTTPAPTMGGGCVGDRSGKGGGQRSGASTGARARRSQGDDGARHPDSSKSGGRRDSLGGSASPERNSGRAHRHGVVGTGDTGGTSSPFRILSPFSFRLFGTRGGGDDADYFPESMDPDPRTPSVMLAGAGAAVQSAGRTPGRGLRPWRLMGRIGTMFGGEGDGGDVGKDAAGDVQEEAAASARAAGNIPPMRGGPFAPSPLGSPFAMRPSSGRAPRRAAAGARGGATPGSGSGGVGVPPGSPLPPVGMAAEAQGRFQSLVGGAGYTR